MKICLYIWTYSLYDFITLQTIRQISVLVLEGTLVFSPSVPLLIACLRPPSVRLIFQVCADSFFPPALHLNMFRKLRPVETDDLWLRGKCNWWGGLLVLVLVQTQAIILSLPFIQYNQPGYALRHARVQNAPESQREGGASLQNAQRCTTTPGQSLWT